MDRANSVLHRGSDYRGMCDYVLRENGDGEIIRPTGPRYEDSEGALRRVARIHKPLYNNFRRVVPPTYSTYFQSSSPADQTARDDAADALFAAAALSQSLGTS